MRPLFVLALGRYNKRNCEKETIVLGHGFHTQSALDYFTRAVMMPLTKGVLMNKIKIANWSDLQDREPTYALVAGVDLVVVRFDQEISVFYGRCLHRGALMSDGFVDGNDNLICGLHN